MTMLVFFTKIFEMAEFCIKSLQKTSINVESTITLIDTLKAQLSDFDHERVIAHSLELAAKFQINEFSEHVSRRQKSLPVALRTSHVMTTVGHNTLSSIDDLLILLKRVIGHISGELQARFSHDQQDVMRVVSAFCRSSPNFLNMDLLNKVSERYGFTISCSEVDVVKAFLQKSNLKESTLFDIFDSVDKDIFPGVHHMLRILLTIPQTSVTVERLFSSVKRIKTRMRSKMNTSRLSALALLSFEKDIARNLNRCSVIQRFRRMKNRRLL